MSPTSVLSVNRFESCGIAFTQSTCFGPCNDNLLFQLLLGGNTATFEPFSAELEFDFGEIVCDCTEFNVNSALVVGNTATGASADFSTVVLQQASTFSLQLQWTGAATSAFSGQQCIANYEVVRGQPVLGVQVESVFQWWAILITIGLFTIIIVIIFLCRRGRCSRVNSCWNKRCGNRCGHCHPTAGKEPFMLVSPAMHQQPPIVMATAIQYTASGPYQPPVAVAAPTDSKV